MYFDLPEIVDVDRWERMSYKALGTLSFIDVVFLISICQIVEGYKVPKVEFQVYTPKGLRVSIPDNEDTTWFNFHGSGLSSQSYNKPVDIDGNGTRIGMKWTFFDPNVKLRIGDAIFGWISTNNSGHIHLDTVEYIIGELKPLESSCTRSKSQWEGKSDFCKGVEIFMDDFVDLDITKWKPAQFAPSEPDFEFCSYQIHPGTGFVANGVLTFKPKLLTNEDDVRGTLDLRDGCTSNLDAECLVVQEGGFILPPVISSRITLQNPFKYGAIEIRAKLPCGDWLYPEIYLQSAVSAWKKIRIAFSRGNQYFTCSDVDVGASRLFGGPSLSTSEPERSKLLSSTKSTSQFCNAYHKYSLIWEEERFTLGVDDLIYGTYYSNTAASFNDPMYLVLGVGVGGLTDFPDNCIGPNGTSKPWKNKERLMVKKFYSSRDVWFPTWSNSATMDVEYVKISAV